MVMDDIVQRLLRPRVICWVHSTGTPPRAGGYAPDSDCVEAAREIERLQSVVAKVNAKCDHLAMRLGEVIRDRDCEKRLRKDSDDQATRLREALTDVRDRIKDHPAYEDLTEADELRIGGDTVELSYMARVADDALGPNG